MTFSDFLKLSKKRKQPAQAEDHFNISRDDLNSKIVPASIIDSTDLFASTDGIFNDENDDYGECQPSLKISDLIDRLSKLKTSHGNLTLCVSSEDVLFTLTDTNVKLDVTNRSKYDFSVGLTEPTYLSIRIN